MATKPHQKTLLSRLGKKAAPLLSVMFNRYPFNRFLTLLSWYIPFIQGQGSGTGCDIEAEIRAAIKCIDSDRPIIFDVGANMGEWSKLIAEKLNASYKLFQFEPAQHCRNILSGLELPDTILIEAAAGNYNGKAELYLPAPGSGIASLHHRRDSYFQELEYVKEQIVVVTLDEIINDYNIDIVDFMKIDTEGHDLEVLKGCEQSIKAKKIKALSFEFGSGNINSRTFFHDFWDFLIPYGYEIKRIRPGGVLMPISEYYEDLEYFRGVTNYIAELKK